MKEKLKKRLNVPDTWDKYDYETHRYSFNDVLEIVEEFTAKESTQKHNDVRRSLFNKVYDKIIEFDKDLVKFESWVNNNC